MSHSTTDEYHERIAFDRNQTVNASLLGGVTVLDSVHVQVNGNVVGPVTLHYGSSLKINGVCSGPLRVDRDAVFTLSGIYDGQLPEHVDGILVASQGTMIHGKILLDGKLRELPDGGNIDVDASKFYRLTSSTGSTRPGEF